MYSKAGDAFLLLAPLRDGDFGNYAHIALIETNRTHIGELYLSFVRKRALEKYQSQSEVIKVMLYRVGTYE